MKLSDIDVLTHINMMLFWRMLLIITQHSCTRQQYHVNWTWVTKKVFIIVAPNCEPCSWYTPQLYKHVDQHIQITDVGRKNIFKIGKQPKLFGGNVEVYRVQVYSIILNFPSGICIKITMITFYIRTMCNLPKEFETNIVLF